MLQIKINGKNYSVADSCTILQALRQADISVPTLCHDERLKPYGGCRLCIVQVNRSQRPVTSCNTKVEAGMEIETHTKEIEEQRRTLLKLFARNYPADAAKKFPDKEFHRYLRQYGLQKEIAGKKNRNLVDDSHPYIHVDMSQCVTCYRCVRICEEVQGQFVWKVWNRGDKTRIVPDSGTTLSKSSCVSCGACVDTCPTGALEDKSILKFGFPTDWKKTTCPYCGTGCEMNVGTKKGRIVSIRPALDSPVNKGHLCVKGRYSFEFVYSKDRVTQPMIRRKGKWKKVSWDEAISFTAESLKRLLLMHGADSIGVLGSARATNEENFLAQKFARAVLQTNNVDCCARVCHGPTAAAMKMTLGTGAATNSYNDIEVAKTIMLCGSNATENHPVIGARIKQAALRGANLIVIDPRKIELTKFAAVHLHLNPGTNVSLLNAIACAIVEENLFDESFVAERAADWDDFRKFIRTFSPERVESICGVNAELIRKAARIYAGKKPSMCLHGLGMTEHVQGTDGVMCMVNLALLTGNVGKPGTGVNPLRGQNNVQGSAHMGCEPSNLTGFVSIESGRQLFESVWKTAIPTGKGLNLMQMVDSAADGRLKALWCIGYDVALTNPNAKKTIGALGQIELVIVQDMFLNETAKKVGTVFLPCTSSFEKDGTFMNAERRISRVRKMIRPVGNSRPDWEIICSIAAKMGAPQMFNFRSPEEIWNEVRAVWKVGAGISYERIENGGLQWPCTSTDHPGTTILHSETFPIGKKAPLKRIEFKPTAEQTDSDFPFLLITGRTLYHFNAGTMTMRTANVELHETDFLDVSPEDAARLKLKNGARVKVVSRYGRAVLPVRINPALKPGELFTTFHSTEIFLNNVTGPYRDSYVLTPEYKVTAVNVLKN